MEAQAGQSEVEEEATKRSHPTTLDFDGRVEMYQKGGSKDGDEKDFPTLFGIDSFGPSTFYRPSVWNGTDHAAAGLLGFQAPAADGLDETFTPFPRTPVLAPQASQQAVSTVNGKAKGKKATKAIPRLPVEIHLEIFSHLLDTPQTVSCSFCHLFQLSTLSKVSRLYHSLLQPYLYSTLNLNFDSSLNNRSGKHRLCDAHFRLGSKHQQLELRVPLLLRTLSARPDLARGVRRLILPTGGIKTYLTCALEKTHLPSLINKCQHLEDIYGAENLLCRQFSGEHYCLDGIKPQQHGMLSKALYEKKSWKRWCWNGGNAAGCDFWHRLWDSHPDMERIGFVELHQNWSQLEHLEIRNVWGIDANMVKSIITKLPGLRRLALVGVCKKRLGRGDVSTTLATLNILPASVKHVELGDVPEDTFLTAVGEWVRLRHAINESSMLESLSLTRTVITALNLRAFLAAISVNRVKGWPCARKYCNLLDFTPRWWSLVRRLSLDNSGFESAFCPLDAEVGPESMDLRGLEELDWRVRSERGNGSVYLGQRLQFGWFRDMKMLEGVGQEDDCIRVAAKARSIEVL